MVAILEIAGLFAGSLELLAQRHEVRTRNLESTQVSVPLIGVRGARKLIEEEHYSMHLYSKTVIPGDERPRSSPRMCVCIQSW